MLFIRFFVVVLIVALLAYTLINSLRARRGRSKISFIAVFSGSLLVTGIGASFLYFLSLMLSN